MVEAATSFRKNSFNDSDSATLAKVATTFQNVSDEAISASESADFIIAQMKAFNIEADDAEHIIDAVNAVSNSYAVSSGQLAKNLGNMSSALAVGNNSFEESLGLLTAGVEVTRNASKVSRALVSVQSRLNQVIDESSSTGQALTEWYQEHGIAILDQEGQLRSLYDVLTDVSEIWPTLTKNEQAYYLNQQAGANQSQNLAAILSNFDTAAKATATALNSAGSAMRENEAYQSSLEYQTSELKAEFQDLANNVIDKQVITGFLNLGQTMLKVANTDFGQFVTKVGLLGGASWGIESLLHVSKILPTIGKQFTNLGTAIKLAAGGAGTFGEAIAAVGGGASVALPIILAISAAIIGCIEAYKAFEEAQEAKKFENLVNNYESLKEEADGAADKLEELKQKLEDLNAVPEDDRDQQWRDEQAEVKTLIEYYNQLERARKAQADEAGAAAYGADRESGVTVGQYYQGKYGAESKEIGRYSTTTEAVTKLAEEKGVTLTSEQIDELSELTDDGERAAKAIDFLKQNLEALHYTFDSTTVSASEYQSTQGQLMLDLAETASKSGEVSDAVLEQRDAYMNANEAEYLYLTGLETLNETQQKFVNGYEAIAEIGGTQAQNIRELGTAAEESVGAFEQYNNILANYEAATAGASGATENLVKSLFDTNGQLTDTASYALSTNGSMADMAQSFIQAQQAQSQANFQNLINQIYSVGQAASITTSQISSMMSAAGVGIGISDTELSKNLRRTYQEKYKKSVESDPAAYKKWLQDYAYKAGQEKYQIEQKKYQEQLEQISSFVPSSYGGGGSSSSTKSDQEEVKAQTINTIEELREYLTDESTRLKLIDPDISKSDLQSTLSEVATIYQSYQDYLSQLKQQGFDETSEQYKAAEAEFTQFLAVLEDLFNQIAQKGNYTIEELYQKLQSALGDSSELASSLADGFSSVSSSVDEATSSLKQMIKQGKKLQTLNVVAMDSATGHRVEISEAYKSGALSAEDIVSGYESAWDILRAEYDYDQEQYEQAVQDALKNAAAEKDVAEEVSNEYEWQNKLLEDKIALEEKLEALERAKQRRMLVYSEGRFQYMQDADAISSAQADYQETYRDVEQSQIQSLMNMIGNESSSFFTDYFSKENADVLGYGEALRDHLMGYLGEKIGGSLFEGMDDAGLYDIFGDAMQPGAAYSQILAAYRAEQEAAEKRAEKKAALKKQIREENVRKWGVDTDFGEKIKNAESQAEAAYWADLRDAKLEMIKEYKEAYGTEAASKYFSTDASSIDSWKSNEDLYREAWDSGNTGYATSASDFERQHLAYNSDGSDRYTVENPDLEAAKYNVASGLTFDGYSKADQALYNKIFEGSVTKDQLQKLYDSDELSDVTKGYILNLASELKKSGATGYASGTKSASGGLSLVGENGPELRVLNQGDGILPNSITDNLWRWGSMTPSDMLTSLAQKAQSWAQTLNISNVTLPNVRDAQSFVSGLRELAQQYVTRRS